jgi:hypothetical protein
MLGGGTKGDGLGGTVGSSGTADQSLLRLFVLPQQARYVG